jgi:hypothetical protein
MADERDKKQEDLALTAQEAEDVKGGQAGKKKGKKKKTGAHTGGGRFQPQ